MSKNLGPKPFVYFSWVGVVNIRAMQNQSGSIDPQSAASSVLAGAGSVIGPVATGVPHSPALADALAMHSDQIAVARDFWGAASVITAGITVVHPGQGKLFEQH